MTVFTLLFKPFAPSFLLEPLLPNDNLYAGQWALLVILITWVGFGLYSGWNWTVRLFEGYYFPARLKSKLSTRLEDEYKKKSSNILNYQGLLHKKELSEQDKVDLKDVEYKAVRDYAELSSRYPIGGGFLPTRLGNVLRSSENYAFERYRMESITFFPKLVHLCPKDFANQLEETNNKFIFLLNSSFLSLLIGGMCLLLVFLRAPCFILHPALFEKGLLHAYGGFACTVSQTPQNFFQRGFTTLSEWEYFYLGIILLAVGYLIYRIATVMARGYANLIRATFDLYRYDLLKNLRIPMPEDFEDETGTWLTLTNFFIAGNALSAGEIIPDFNPAAENIPISPAPVPVEMPTQMQVDVTLKKTPQPKPKKKKRKKS